MYILLMASFSPVVYDELGTERGLVGLLLLRVPSNNGVVKVFYKGYFAPILKHHTLVPGLGMEVLRSVRMW